MNRLASRLFIGTVVTGAIALPLAMAQKPAPAPAPPPARATDGVLDNASRMVDAGRDTFRNDTFGSEAFWADTIQLHKAIAGEKLGGIGGGVSPKTALAVGLKVDAEKIPAATAAAIKGGKVNLDDPATTLALLKLDAVVGVKGTFDPQGKLTAVGIQCSLCHSTVDDSFAPGIGKRRDGWPNRDLDVGTIISLAPNLAPVEKLLGVNNATLKKVLTSWGPGRFDAEVFFDGKAMRPDGKSASTLIPAAFGLAGVNMATYVGWGSITYWNAMVAVNEMHGVGRFFDARLADKKKYPIAVKAKSYDTKPEADRVTAKLGALHFYQLALPVPTPPAGSVDAQAVTRGGALFNGAAKCASCHVPPLYTEPGNNMHLPAEIGIDAFQANRGPVGRYRTTPLRGMFTKTKGGFYHDGRFATMPDVVEHYDRHFKLRLDAKQKADLAAFVMSL
ncbi:MAG: hypothetical protein H0T42_15075 [Deltaproteobacteria bacterium]|nr:hypothetical protein [Deltaproteobacteria bacterium]